MANRRGKVEAMTDFLFLVSKITEDCDFRKAMTNLDWRFISYLIGYMFQCQLPNHPTLFLSHRVQKSVLYICVSFFFLILKSLILTCVPKHEPPSHRPPPNISLGHPHTPAPSMLYPASDIDLAYRVIITIFLNSIYMC